MRKIAIALASSLCLMAGSANAVVTVDLIWADSSSATLTVNPGDATAGTSSVCNGPAFAAGSGHRCVKVVMTTSVALLAAQSAVGWDQSNISVIHAASLSKFTSTTTFFPANMTIKNAPNADCDLPCSNNAGAYGGVSLSPTSPGTYTIGTFAWDVTGASIGTHILDNFYDDGVSGYTDMFGNDRQDYILNDAILNVVPEPGTASLLGLGMLGLVLAGRRRKA